MPYLQNVDTANIENVEVLKGPAAALYGRMPPGGLVDFVTKTPLDRPYYSIEQDIASFGQARTEFDLTGPLDASKTWLYRLSGDFTRADSFVNFENSQNILLAPALTFRPSDRFQITVQGEYQNVRNVDSDPNFPAIGNRPAQIPISTYLEDPGVTKRYPDTMEREFIGYNWVWNLANDWKLTNRLAYNNLDQNVTNMFFASVDNTGQGVNSLMLGKAGEQTFSTNLELTGKQQTGPLDHALLVGTDYLYFHTFFNGSYDYNAQNINIYNPFASYNTINLTSALDPSNGFALLGTQSWYGVYAQDTISAFNDRVHLMIGGRYDWANTGSGSAFGDPNAWADANSSYASARDGGFSPRIGLSVDALPWATIYGNYSKALGPSNVTSGVTTSGAPLGPQWATQEEVGVKTQFFDRRLTATLAFYNITQDNVPVATAAPGVYTLAGQANSRGLELDVAGKLGDNWDVIANYTHDIAKVTKGYGFNPADPQDNAELPVIGSVLPAVPTDMGSLWIKYTGTGELAGWQYGAGVTGVGQAQGDLANSFQMPAYSVVRGMISRQFNINRVRLTAQLNLDNALNQVYFYGATGYSNRTSLTPGTPRTIKASLRAEF